MNYNKKYSTNCIKKIYIKKTTYSKNVYDINLIYTLS